MTTSVPPPSKTDLFTAFLKIGALGFGGVAPLARHVLVVERKMVDERSFAELFSLASAMPGANTVNFSILLGDRFARLGGAMAAIAGLLLAPLLFLVVIAWGYDKLASFSDAQAALAGAAAAAAGLVGGTSYRLLRAIGFSARTLALAGSVCLLVGLWRVPMLFVFLVFVPVAFWWRADRSA